MHSFYQTHNQLFQCKISTDLSYPSHLHKQVEIMYVLSGETKITISGITKTLYENDLSISFPNTIHSFHTIGNSKVLVIIFDSYLVDNYTSELENTLPSDPFLTSDHVHKDLMYCLHALNDMDKTNQNSNLTKGFLLIILSRILEKLELVEGSYNDLNLIHHVLQYVDSHYTQSITLDTMAKQLNASKFYLSRIFNNKLKTTFNLYVNNKRINLAKHLLINTELSITEICYQSGFDSTRTFYRAFSLNQKITPSEYRKLHLEFGQSSI